jgi:quercetin dioxygenase-like cupin family protein
MANEVILQSAEREIAILVASGQVTVTQTRCVPGEQIAGPHVHRGHTDAFYVLEGELTFEIGCERQMITISTGGLVAAPPGVAHSFRTAGDVPARWLTIHAEDGGFAAFLRGMRDGVEVDWDISPVLPGGGLPAGAATIRR